MAAPLLEEERDILLHTTIAQVVYPRWVATAMTMAGLTAGDEPINVGEV